MKRSTHSLAAILSLSLIACNQEQPAPDAAETKPATTATSPSPTPAASAKAPSTPAGQPPMPVSDNSPVTAGNPSPTEVDAQAEARKDIQSKDKGTRLDAVLMLDPENPGDLKLLLETLNTDPEAEIRTQIAENLGYGDYVKAVPALITALQDKQSDVVLAAIDALSSFDGKEKPDIVKALQTLKSHPDPQVQEAVQSALDTLKTEE